MPGTMRQGAVVLFFLAGISISSSSMYAQDANLPHLEKRGEVTQLIVDGQPFLMLAGEILIGAFVCGMFRPARKSSRVITRSCSTKSLGPAIATARRRPDRIGRSNCAKWRRTNT